MNEYTMSAQAEDYVRNKMLNWSSELKQAWINWSKVTLSHHEYEGLKEKFWRLYYNLA